MRRKAPLFALGTILGMTLLVLSITFIRAKAAADRWGGVEGRFIGAALGPCQALDTSGSTFTQFCQGEVLVWGIDYQGGAAASLPQARPDRQPTQRTRVIVEFVSGKVLFSSSGPSH